MTKPTIPLVCACGMLALALAASAQPLPAGMTVEMSLEEALGKMAMYQTGHSRLPISVVSDHIVTLQNRRDEKALRQFSYTLLGYLDAYWAGAEGKREIIRQLAKISGSEAVPALAKAVKDKDLWDMALLALEDIPSREADAALRELLSTSEGRARLGVIQTLGLRGDPASVGPLSRILAGDADTTARVTAARALARIGGRSARAALLDSLDDPSDPVHRELADAVMALAQGMARSGDRSGAYRLYERLHRPAEPTTVRSAALLGMLTTAGGSRAEKLWVQSIHGDAEAQRIAVQAMTALTGRKTTAVMASELPKLPPTLQAYVIAGLSARSDREALPAVTTVVEKGVEEGAPRSLPCAGRRRQRALLVAALGAEDKATSAAVCASLIASPARA
ncbi:HEAT repeat domain-containing protein [bacterium]|nr:HEAT repeat domain-containing protein [bacterium]